MEENTSLRVNAFFYILIRVDFSFYALADNH